MSASGRHLARAAVRFVLRGLDCLITKRGNVYLYWLITIILVTLRPFMVRGHVSGAEILKRPGPLIIASNHVGWYELVFITVTILPRRIRFMAKHELFRHPAAAWALRGLGAFPIHRGSPTPSEWKEAIRLTREGYTIGVLAAGTRGGNQAKQGAARLALTTGTPLVTARFEGPLAPHIKHLFTRPHAYLRFDMVYDGVSRGAGATRLRPEELTNRIDAVIHSG